MNQTTNPSTLRSQRRRARLREERVREAKARELTLAAAAELCAALRHADLWPAVESEATDLGIDETTAAVRMMTRQVLRRNRLEAANA